MSKSGRKTSASSRRKGRGGAIISHHTILILSAFLYGIVMAGMVDSVMQHYVLAAASGGLVAYIGLRLEAKTRHELLTQLRDQKDRYELENRLTKHMPRRSRIREDISEAHQKEQQPQYLTVTRTSQLRARV